MKKLLSLLMTITVLMSYSFITVSLSSCSRVENEIKQVEADISDIKNDLSVLRRERNEWQDLYDDAYAVYQRYSKYSNDPDYAYELGRTKRAMNEAKSKVDSIEREIRLLEARLGRYEERLANLKSELENSN